MTSETDRSVLQVVLKSPRPVRVLVLGVFLNRLGSFFATFLVLFLTQLGFSLQQLPLILLVVGVAAPLGSLLGGWSADRFSRRTALISSTLLSAVSLAVIGLAPSRAAVLVAVFVAGMFTQAYLPAAAALLVDSTREQDRVPTFAFFRLALNVGAALGPLLAIVVADRGLELLFLVDSATYALFALVIAIGLPGRGRAARGAAPVGGGAVDDPSGAGTGGTGTSETPPARAGSGLGLLALYAAVLVITVVYVQYSSTLSLSVSSSHSASAYAALLTVNGVLVIIGELPLSGFTRRLTWWVPLAVGIVLMAAGIALSGAATPYLLILAGVVTWTVGEMFYSPVVATAVAAISPPDRIGRYQGYLASVQAVGFAFGPAIGTAVYGWSPQALWLGCLAAGGLAGAATLVAGRTAARQDRQAAALAAA